RLDVMRQEQRSKSSEALFAVEQFVEDGELLRLVETRHGIVENDEVRLITADLMHEQDEREGVPLSEAQMAAGRFQVARSILMLKNHPVRVAARLDSHSVLVASGSEVFVNLLLVPLN